MSKRQDKIVEDFKATHGEHAVKRAAVLRKMAFTGAHIALVKFNDGEVQFCAGPFHTNTEAQEWADSAREKLGAMDYTVEVTGLSWPETVDEEIEQALADLGSQGKGGKP